MDGLTGDGRGTLYLTVWNSPELSDEPFRKRDNGDSLVGQRLRGLVLDYIGSSEVVGRV